MAEHSRYSVGSDESDLVLKNKLFIKDQKMLNDLETLLFSDTYEFFFKLLKTEKLVFNVGLIFRIHKYFLSTLYAWAGKVRTVEISKNGILFCASTQIKKELKKFDVVIQKNLPKIKDSTFTVSQKLAIIHCEFNAIHPFREGNGRTIRLLLDLIAVQLGLRPIDYTKTTQKEYIKGCIAGMEQDYSKMQKVGYR